MKNKKVISFKKFIKTIYKDEMYDDTFIHDFTYDALKAKDFPYTNNYRTLFYYLKKKNACANAILGFSETYNKYLEFIMQP